MQWINHGERTVFSNPWLTVNMADVELPNGRRIEHTVIREPRVVLCVAVRDGATLLIWRHRFITDTWGWEIPGGRVDKGESPEAAAARELEEETGWRAIGPLGHLLTVEPANGISDATYDLYLAHEVVQIGEPTDRYESERVEWVPLIDVPGLIEAGTIRGADTVAGLLFVLHRVLKN